MSRGSAGVFLLLLLLHLGAIAALVQADAAITEPKIDMEPPKLQGMLIAPETYERLEWIKRNEETVIFSDTWTTVKAR